MQDHGVQKEALGKISALRKARVLIPPDANRKEIELKNLYFLTC